MTRPPRLGRAAPILILSMIACGEEPPDHTPAAPPSAHVTNVEFIDATRRAGIEFRHVTGAYGSKYLPETMGSGAIVLDADGDDRDDLFLINGTWWPDDPQPREPARSALFRNNGDGTFSDWTERAGLARSSYGMGGAAADYDNDGDIDLFVTTVGDDLLYRNEGGRFVEVAREAGVADPGFGSSAAFVDYDKDGRLDLFVCNYVVWTPGIDIFCTLDGQSKSYCTPESYQGQSSRLYRNAGDGRFEDVSEAAGVLNPAGKSLGVAVLDYDGDGWEDLAVANDTQPNYLYRNRGDGTFEEVGAQAGIAFSEAGIARGAMGIDAADYDGSGRESIVIGNFSNEMIGLYHNEGGDLFIDDAASAGVGLPSLLTLAFGTFFFDHDLDGLLDIFVANGHVENDINRVQQDITYAQPPHLFRNLGDGKFRDTAGSATGGPLSRPIVARGAAYLDHDADGDLDIVVTTSDGPAHLYENDGGNRNSWLRVRLAGTVSNKAGIGARVRVIAGGESREQVIRTGSSYCSQPETVATFGLGGTASIDRVEVEWPSGAGSRVEKPAINSLLLIAEPAEPRASR